MPPPDSCAPAVSKPPTSSPCQQCREMGIASSAFMAASASTPRLAYCSFAVWYVCVSLSSFITFSSALQGFLSEIPAITRHHRRAGKHQVRNHGNALRNVIARGLVPDVQDYAPACIHYKPAQQYHHQNGHSSPGCGGGGRRGQCEFLNPRTALQAKAHG